MGHQQLHLIKTSSKTRYNHGGSLRKLKSGRGLRPLSTREPLHVVWKAHRFRLREKSFRGYRSFILSQKIIKKYAAHFRVKIEQISVQGDHIHALIRTYRRSQFHHFFRVVSGQIAQVFEKEGLLKSVTDTPRKVLGKGTGLWIYRPFSRVVRGWRALKTIRDYIQLNEKEALGEIKYNKQRLRGLSSREWDALWK